MPLDTLAMVMQAEGRREMERTGDRVALAEREEAAVSSQQVANYEKQRAEEKPEASEEIVIEEINIDGMCGVY